MNRMKPTHAVYIVEITTLDRVYFSSVPFNISLQFLQSYSSHLRNDNSTQTSTDMPKIYSIYSSHSLSSSFARPLFRKVKVVSEPLSPDDLLNGKTRIAVREWQEEVPASSNKGEDEPRSDPRTEQALPNETLARRQVVLGSLWLLAALGSLIGNLVLDSILAEDEFY